MAQLMVLKDQQEKIIHYVKKYLRLKGILSVFVNNILSLESHSEKAYYYQI